MIVSETTGDEHLSVEVMRHVEVLCAKMLYTSGVDVFIQFKFSAGVSYDRDR
jgi:hypothetical protein